MQYAEYYTYDRAELAPFIPQNIKRTLDVGCANGAFSSRLKQERNVEAWGIEMQKEAAEAAKLKLDRVLVGSFDEVRTELKDEQFDCVFFNDVLEHMPAPEDCLTKIRENVHAQGHIVASIPNMRFIDVLKDLLFKKDWKYTDSGIMDRTHLRFFTKKSILRMFNDCGYKVDRIEGINGVGSLSLTSILNILSFNNLSDIKYRQFVVVASPK